MLKHTVLVFCLEHLKKKEKPFLCVDTHSGAGFYALAGGAMNYPALKLPRKAGSWVLHPRVPIKNREWEAGIGRLSAPADPLPPILKTYLRLIAGYPGHYPGSPEIIRTLLRPQDRAACFELHPEDLRLLTLRLRDDRRFSVRGEDGFEGLKSLLPPRSRRGLILVDPAYEEKTDYRKVPETLREALRRFPGGAYIIWYPLLARYGPSEQFPEELLALSTGNRCGAEFYTAPRTRPPDNSPRGMYGSGLVIFNPPWTLRGALEELLPVLAARLGTGKADWKLRWKPGTEGSRSGLS